MTTRLRSGAVASLAANLFDASIRLGDAAVARWRARPRGLRPAVPNPAANRSYFYSGTGSAPLPFVTNEQVLGLPAAGRAVRLIANAVASMAPPRYLAADGITDLGPPPPVAARPNPTFGITEFWRMVVAHWLVGCDCLFVRDADGKPIILTLP